MRVRIAVALGILAFALVLVPPLSQAAPPGPAQAGQAASQAAPQEPSASSRELTVTVGKSISMDSPVNIERVSVANAALAEAVAISPREILINGKAPGETSLIIWQRGGNRLFFDLIVLASTTRLEAVRAQIRREFEGQNVTVELEGEIVLLRGTVQDMIAADRAVTLAATLGKPINLLSVKVPPVEPQILLKVRFADVDRGWSRELGANLFSTGALNTPAIASVGTFSSVGITGSPGAGVEGQIRLTDALNIFLFRSDLNLGATIRALEGKRLLQILAEPNLLTINGKQASFLAGGEFPYPTLQGGGAGLGAVTISFREFGVRVSFLPTITPRGTIRLQVTPEVSSLDYANALTFQGFTIPGLATRRVTTEVELDNQQSFALAGLLDNRLTDSFSKIPGLGDIPVLGKLFQSKREEKSNTELLVLVTPELVRPIPEGQPLPDVTRPRPFLEYAPQVIPRTPGIEVTGPVPVKPPTEAVPVERMMEQRVPPSQVPGAAPAPVEFVPVPLYPQPGQPAQPRAPAPAAAKPAAGGSGGK